MISTTNNWWMIRIYIPLITRLIFYRSNKNPNHWPKCKVIVNINITKILYLNPTWISNSKWRHRRNPVIAYMNSHNWILNWSDRSIFMISGSIVRMWFFPERDCFNQSQYRRWCSIKWLINEYKDRRIRQSYNHWSIPRYVEASEIDVPVDPTVCSRLILHIRPNWIKYHHSNI